MSFLINNSVKFADSPSVDAFARARVSEPFTIFDSKQLNDNQPLLWDTVGSGATSGSTWNQLSASTVMSVGAVNNTFVIRQTKMSFNYQPGKSQMFLMTGTMSTEANVMKRIGAMDSLNTIVAPYTPYNGIYFQNDGTNMSVNIVKNGVISESVNQSAWNLDNLIGTGGTGNPSKITLDMSKSQIFLMDFEWLGVGRVRTGFVFNGIPTYVHQFTHANQSTGIYMGNPNLPVRYEIRSTGGAGSLEHICASVTSEGGFNPNGITKTVTRGNTGLGFNNLVAGTIVPLISMRLKAGATNTTIIINNISMNFVIAASTTLYVQWLLILNPTIAGSDAASWTNLTNSAVQYDISRTTTNTLSNGTILDSGYGFVSFGNTGAGGNSSLSSEIIIDTPLRLGTTINGVLDQYVLAIQPINTAAPATSSGYASIMFKEIA